MIHGEITDNDLFISEARLRRAQSVARLGVWELDLKTKVMWGSDEAFRIYGLSPTPDSSLPYDLVKEIPLPESRLALDRALAELVQIGKPYKLLFRIMRHSDSAVRWINSRAEATFDDSGKPVLLTGTIQDVTENEEAARALQEGLRANEERARLILEQAADAIFLTDTRGVFTGVNELACKLTGYERDQLLGCSIRLLFSVEVLADEPLRFDLIDNGEVVVREGLLTRGDGSQVLVEMRTKKLSDGTVQAIVRDISERRRLEEQLFLRQRMDSLGTLAAGIAHDFNNILAAIVGYADALRLSDSGLDATQQRYATNILQCSQRAADLTRGLRMMTCPSLDTSEVYDLHTVASEVFQVLSETTDRMIDKEMLIPPNRYYTVGSASALYHALMNLGINAIQAIEQKGPMINDRVYIEAYDYKVEIDGRHSLPPGRYVHLMFSDTGAGIPSEVRKQVFDPLFTTKEKGERKGQGLGLAMVYNVVVRQHRGQIEIDSPDGRGCTVHLYLPRAEAVEEVPEISPRTLRGGDETILLVEDELQIAKMTREVLEGVGYKVLLAGDGGEGIEVFDEHREEIDLVLLDRTLPKVSGEQVHRHMIASRPDLAVVVSSGDAAVNLESFPGAACILAKPYRLASLCDTIREVIQQGDQQPWRPSNHNP